MFPRRRPDPYDLQVLSEQLIAIGQAVRRGELAPTGTVGVPYPRRTHMKVKMDGKGPDGFGWHFTMEYDKLSPAYASDLAQLAESFASLIDQKGGSAATGDPTYVVTFEASSVDLPGPHKAKGKIEGRANDLHYSEMLALQDAGIELLKQANVPGHNEVASGQRK